MPTLSDAAYVRQAKAYLRLRRHWRADPVRYVTQRFGVGPTALKCRFSERSPRQAQKSQFDQVMV